MDYIYETLGDERFQEFCSALIAKEFPNVQVFPVGQPDGGRDTIVYSTDAVNKKFKVFQVKFVRNALEERDLHRWLEKTVQGESEKINVLIEKGATEYYILTNVRGTAHLDTGSKDRVNKILEDNVKIPSICWWRDDITAMFEKDPLFKWSYPQVLNGQDILNSALFCNLNENKQRQENVIRAYLVDQFELDSEVKFKQIDLQNKLTSLYADVPLKIKKINKKDKALKRALADVFDSGVFISEEEMMYHEPNEVMGAAEFFLHRSIQNKVRRLLLEGGPGQGKSTISQYVCHVHRSKLLKKEEELIGASDGIKNAPVRLPLKIDLRHIAAWIEESNPYNAVLSEDYFTKNWKKSLESFLIAHIVYHSKIEEFSITDFLTVSKLTPILFVFDGFDEIANIASRKEVIEFIDKGIHRLSVNVESIQVIITSRPAAFSESVVFSTDNYPHFELVDITDDVINQYVEKWIKAGRMDSRDATEIRNLASQKLKLPHLKELAKSPMQLAIFLSLLKTKGQSLPNKRTALYDSYINLFFDRESEKSNLVRDKRDLIIDIHQYLAWVLHSEAERYNSSGIIGFDKLKDKVKDYLELEGHDVAIADQLFDVMKERVCALVSRVQGTFEFEVQPLREYFCAKYLYTTAQNSTAGESRSGTKPDRFHALLRNSYWHNVLRFFAGCADAGELDMIIEELRELQQDEFLKFTHYPRIVTAQILSDYVFTQKPKKLINVVQLIVDGINIGTVVNQSSHVSRSEHIVLPEACGRNELVAECFRQLAKFPKNDYAWELISIIANNPHQNLKNWISHLSNFTSDENITEWFRLAYHLEIIHEMDEKMIDHFLSIENEEHLLRRVIVVLNSKGSVYFDKKDELKKFAVEKMLERSIEVIVRSRTSSGIGFLSAVLHPHISRNIFHAGESDMTAEHYISRLLEAGRGDDRISVFSCVDNVDFEIKKYADSVSGALSSTLQEFRTNLAPWDLVVENGRQIFGERWAFYVIATISAAVKGRHDDVSEFFDLQDNSKSLCRRARYARLKSGNVKYWEDLFLSKADKNFVLLLYITWATPKVLLEMGSFMSNIIKKMRKTDLEKIERILLHTTEQSQFNNASQGIVISDVSKISESDALKYLISFRFPSDAREDFILKNIDLGFLKTRKILGIKLQSLIDRMIKGNITDSLLSQIKDLYRQVPRYHDRYFYAPPIRRDFSLKLAQEVMANCKDYPRVVSVLAERTCRINAVSKQKPIGEISEKDKWFE